jgi:cytochrome c biogenesis protein CcmG/thiol:disulfide interchange protein DsbE
MERLKLFVPLLIFLVLAVVLYFGLGRDPRELPSALVDRPLPSFHLPSLREGAPVDEGALRGKVRLLNVWGTWCVACRDEHPFLIELADRGIPIVGLNYKDDPRAARDWLQRLGDPFEQVMVDADGRYGLELGVYGAPETYVVDADGVIRYRHVGVIDPEVWRERIEPVYRKWAARP